MSAIFITNMKYPELQAKLSRQGFLLLKGRSGGRSAAATAETFMFLAYARSAPRLHVACARWAGK